MCPHLSLSLIPQQQGHLTNAYFITQIFMNWSHILHHWPLSIPCLPQPLCVIKCRHYVSDVGHILDISGKFCDVGQMPCLPGGPWLQSASKGVCERLMVHQHCEMTTFKHKPEVANSYHACPQFPSWKLSVLLGHYPASWAKNQVAAKLLKENIAAVRRPLCGPPRHPPWGTPRPQGTGEPGMLQLLWRPGPSWRLVPSQDTTRWLKELGHTKQEPAVKVHQI
jgi:hypothetical protein